MYLAEAVSDGSQVYLQALLSLLWSLVWNYCVHASGINILVVFSDIPVF